MNFELIIPNQNTPNQHDKFLAYERYDRQIYEAHDVKREKASTKSIIGAVFKSKCKRRFYWSSIRKKCVPRYQRPRRPWRRPS